MNDRPSTPGSNASRSQRRVLREVRSRYQLENTGQNTRKTSPRPVSGPAAPGRRPGSSRPHKAHWGRRIALVVFLAIVISGGVFGYKILAAGNKISSSDTTIFGQLKDLLFSSNEFLAGEEDSRINILLIGIGGEGHSGSNLADTIMVASIRPQTNEVALLSIPRDLYVQVPGEEYYSKINSVHAYGESTKKDGGPKALQTTVEEITGLPIHYYVRIDFTAFKSIVDAVGGVNITIDNSFHDYWHKIDFQAGTEKMNGDRALAYVRARYVEGPEGGDFKRAARQQQLLLALREKVFSVNTALDFTSINSIINSLSANIRTDMQLWEMKRFFEISRTIDSSAIHSTVLATGPNGVLTGSTEVLGGVPASILKPRTGNYSEIQNIAANIFSDEISTRIQPSAVPAEDTPPETTPEPAAPKETVKPTIEIRNGTNVTGLAAKTQATLEDKGYEITAIGNAATRTVTKTTAYILNTDTEDGAKEAAGLISAATNSGLPDGEAESSADVLVILGTDAE